MGETLPPSVSKPGVFFQSFKNLEVCPSSFPPFLLRKAGHLFLAVSPLGSAASIPTAGTPPSPLPVMPCSSNFDLEAPSELDATGFTRTGGEVSRVSHIRRTRVRGLLCDPMSDQRPRCCQRTANPSITTCPASHG